MRVVQLGAGKMGQRWLDVLAGADEVTLAGIVEPVDALREVARATSGLGEGQCLATVHEALVSLEFDGAVVVTPPPTHRPLARQLLQAGKHVLLEKPLATTIDDARDLVEIAAETGRTLMVAQNYRYSAAFATGRALIERGRIGPLRAVSIDFRRDTRTLFGEGDFRYGMEHPLLLDMSIHHVDMLRALAGSDAARVYAQSWHVPDGVYQHHAAANVLITMRNGAIVSYRGNWATHEPDTSWNGEWEITGELGRITWRGGDVSDAEIQVQAWAQPAERVPLVQMASEGQAALVAEFVRCVATGEIPDTAAADNLHSLEIVLAAVESAETGRVVSLA